MTTTVTRYRPTGPHELALVAASGYERWPPRLPEQPIVYPVTNEAYAVEVARDWNVPNSGAGDVTRFEVDAAFMARHPTHVVGASRHAEWWVPAEELEALNDNIVGLIVVTQTFGTVPWRCATLRAAGPSVALRELAATSRTVGVAHESRTEFR